MQCYGTSHGTFLKSRRHSKQAFYSSCRRQHFVLFHHLAQIAKRSVLHAFTFEAYLNHIGPQEIGLARVRAKNSSTPALEWGEFHWNETNFPGYGLISGLTLTILNQQVLDYKYCGGEGS